jgi:hypothetical protein
LPQGAVFREGSRLQRAWLQSGENPIGSVDITAAECHEPPGYTPKDCDRGKSVLLRKEHRVNHRLGTEAAEILGVVGQPVTISQKGVNSGRRSSGGLASMENSNLVSRRDQATNDGGTDEPRAADDQNTHTALPS